MKKKNPSYLFIVILAAVAAMSVNATKCGGDTDTSAQLAATTETPKKTGSVTAAESPDSETDSRSGKAEQAQQSSPDGLETPAMNSDVPSQTLQCEGYTASYNSQTLLPNWVAWHLTADRLSGSASRKGVEFSEDERVSAPRADDSDYYNSGYDRGHMCPAADNKMSTTAMQQSFLFTNICPQAPNLNRGDWNELEISCRNWAKKYGGLYIVCGPILYNQKHKTIGKHRVTVPEAFFKVVLRTKGEPKAIGFIYKNADGNNSKDYYVNTVDNVERITGLDFFPLLPDDVEKKVEAEADISDW